MGIGSSLASAFTTAVVERPLTVIFVFILLTAGFATGLNDLGMSSGTDQFAEDVDAYGTNEMVTETFEQPFSPDSGTTLLLYSRENVLSEEGLVAMLSVEQDLADRPGLRVVSTRSTAGRVARELDPSARTYEEQIRAIERSADTERRAAVRTVLDDPGGTDLVGEDANPFDTSASTALGVVAHDVDEDDIDTVQLETRRIADTANGDMRVFGSGISDYESQQVLKDSLSASIPAVFVLLVLFLAIAFRDPFDVVLGIISLVMALVWTFGIQGLLGISFNQLQVAIPPLLLAIGVDFGIHVINRYQEEYGASIGNAMERTLTPLLGAFVMVALTSAIGFASNTTSGLGPIGDFGLAAAVGISSVALVFGGFLPAGKVALERLRERSPIPNLDPEPLGSEDSILGRLLPIHLNVTSRLPVLFVVLALLSAGAAGYYGQDVGSSFEDEDMLPPEDLPDYMDALPGPMAPGEYTTTANMHFLEEQFESTDDTVTVYVEGPLTRDSSLEVINRAGTDPPEPFVTEGRRASSSSIITVIDDYADESTDFQALVDRNDLDDDGIPDRNLEEIYDVLLASPYGDQAERYVTDDYRSTRVIYDVENDASDAAATAGAATIADRMRFDAVETGNTVVFKRVTDAVYASAVSSLLVALLLITGFLVVVHYLFDRRPVLGIVTLSPILLTVAYLVATMRYLGIPFNTLTATILSITVGVGIDYSIHIVHRFVEEYERRGEPLSAARVTLQGTGGALFGTTITTISAGMALYTLSITPILVQFGLLISFSVAYAFVISVVVLPVVLILWTRWEGAMWPSGDTEDPRRTDVTQD